MRQGGRADVRTSSALPQCQFRKVNVSLCRIALHCGIALEWRHCGTGIAAFRHCAILNMPRGRRAAPCCKKSTTAYQHPNSAPARPALGTCRKLAGEPRGRKAAAARCWLAGWLAGGLALPFGTAAHFKKWHVRVRSNVCWHCARKCAKRSCCPARPCPSRGRRGTKSGGGRDRSIAAAAGCAAQFVRHSGRAATNAELFSMPRASLPKLLPCHVASDF